MNKLRGEEEEVGEEEGEDRTQNSMMARFFKVNQNWHNLTPVQKHTLW